LKVIVFLHLERCAWLFTEEEFVTVDALEEL
jgi:hypothetical protein